MLGTPTVSDINDGAFRAQINQQRLRDAVEGALFTDPLMGFDVGQYLHHVHRTARPGRLQSGQQIADGIIQQVRSYRDLIETALLHKVILPGTTNVTVNGPVREDIGVERHGWRGRKGTTYHVHDPHVLLEHLDTTLDQLHGVAARVYEEPGMRVSALGDVLTRAHSDPTYVVARKGVSLVPQRHFNALVGMSEEATATVNEHASAVRDDDLYLSFDEQRLIAREGTARIVVPADSLFEYVDRSSLRGLSARTALRDLVDERGRVRFHGAELTKVSDALYGWETTTGDDSLIADALGANLGAIEPHFAARMERRGVESLRAGESGPEIFVHLAAYNQPLTSRAAQLKAVARALRRPAYRMRHGRTVALPEPDAMTPQLLPGQHVTYGF